MTKKDLADIVRLRNINITVQEADKIINDLINSIKTDLINDGKLELRGFGTLSCVTRKQKIGRNISQNTELIVPEHRIIKFKTSRDFQKELN